MHWPVSLGFNKFYGIEYLSALLNRGRIAAHEVQLVKEVCDELKTTTTDGVERVSNLGEKILIQKNEEGRNA